MSHPSLRKLAIAAGLTLAPAALFAQSGTGPTRPVSIGVVAGGTLPVGDFGDVAKFGYHLGGLVDVKFPTSALGFRAEGVYHRNDIKNFSSENTRILAFTGNLTYPLSSSMEAQPYLIGGAGIYNLKASDLSDSETKFGLNGGVGIKLPLSGFSANIESRFHTVFTDSKNTSFIPFSVNFIF